MIQFQTYRYLLYIYDSVYFQILCQVEYSQRYVETNPQARSLRHLLSEAHLLLRASLRQTSVQQRNTDGSPAASLQKDEQELEEALRQNCAQLGDSFSR